jgi:hypothetical protein
VVAQLGDENVDDDVTPARVAHLYPADCTNIMLTMKSMIQGFVSATPEGLGSSNRSQGTGSDAVVRARGH